MRRALVGLVLAAALISACGGDGNGPQREPLSVSVPSVSPPSSEVVPVYVNGDEVTPECRAASQAYSEAVRANDDLVARINAAGGLTSAPQDLLDRYGAAVEEVNRTMTEVDERC